MPNFAAALSKLCKSYVSLSSSPVIPSMSSAKRRFVIGRPPMLMVPLKFSRACVMISSRNMLKGLYHNKSKFNIAAAGIPVKSVCTHLDKL